MVHLFVLVLLLLAPYVSQAAETEPLLVIDPAEIDLGEYDGASPIQASLLIRNVSDQPAMIAKLSSSCGCTELRADAMALPAGGFTRLHLTIDPFAKQGEITKKVTVTDPFGGHSSAVIRFTVQSDPHAMGSSRSLFDGSCASCHFKPAQGLQQGKALYAAVCAMCHGNDGSGGYAPKLRGLHASTLTTMITHGTGSPAMPAFAQQHGGPLTTAQIQALVDWLR
ncbi:MAG: c-type cytochrome [Mariprofundales bacterium]